MENRRHAITFHGSGNGHKPLAAGRIPSLTAFIKPGLMPMANSPNVLPTVHLAVRLPQIMNITVGQAHIKNSREISALSQELGYSASEIQTQEWLGYLLGSKNHHVLIAVNDKDQLCGWVVSEKRISLEAGFKAEITGLIVGKDFRCLGVGKILVEAVLNWARSLGLSRMVVCSNVQREESHVFYKSIGFSLNKSVHKYELLL